MRAKITEVFGDEGALQRRFEEQYGPQGKVQAILDQYLGERGELQRKVSEFFGDEGHLERRLRGYLGEGGNLERVLDDFLGERGRFRETIEEFLGEEGSLEQSLDQVFGDRGKLKDELEKHFGERGSLLYNLLDPSHDQSVLARFRRQLHELVDPNRDGSAFHDIKKTMQTEFKDLHAKLEARKAADDAREISSHKGRDLETFVYETVCQLGGPLDDRVEHVGDQPGPLSKQGDVLVTVNPLHVAGAEVRVVFEVKNSKISLKGKNSIFADIEEAKKNRGASYAVIVVRAKDAPPEVGAFRIDPKGAIICAVEADGDILPLEVAYKLARAEAARRAAEKTSGGDPSEVLAGLEKIRAKLEMIKGMKSGLTGAENNIQKVRTDLDLLRDDIRDVLDHVTESWGGRRGAEPAA